MKFPKHQCVVDGEEFELDTERATGRYIRQWDVCICSGCDSRDGAVAAPDFLARLKAHGIAPQFTEGGTVLIPR